jgi:apolipoprotein D and lipocalin family protein
MTKHQPAVTKLRVLHNIVGAPPVAIYIDKKLLIARLNYASLTAYLNITKGSHKLRIDVIGTDLSLSVKLNVCGDHYTLIIAGLLSDTTTFKTLLFKDDATCPKPKYALVKFINAAAIAPNLDVYIKNSNVFSNVAYTGETLYTRVSLGAYNIPIKVNNSATNTTVIGPSNLYLVGGGIYTIITTGLDTNLSILVSHDNNNECEELQPNFNAQAYMGKWYQIASIPQPFGSSCANSTAEYTLLPDKVDVFNTCYNKAGKVIDTIQGYAIAENSCIPAALTVKFPSVPVPTFGPNYLIHKTNYDGYALVGSPTRTSFFILSRTSTMSRKQYSKLLDEATALGYDQNAIQPDYNTITK